jgi:hypothetical protein
MKWVRWALILFSLLLGFFYSPERRAILLFLGIVGLYGFIHYVCWGRSMSQSGNRKDEMNREAEADELNPV